MKWNILQQVGLNDKRSRNIKMAECLSEDSILFNEFFCIYVRNDKIKNEVQKLINEYGFNYNPPFIYVQECFFL